FLFEELAVWRATVSLFGDADVEVRINVDADPPLGPENLSHSASICIRDIIAAAQYDQALAVGQYLLDDRGLPVVNFFEAAGNVDVTEVKQTSFYVKRRQAVELLTYRVGSGSGSGSAIVSTDAFVLRTSKNDYV